MYQYKKTVPHTTAWLFNTCLGFIVSACLHTACAASWLGGQWDKGSQTIQTVYNTGDDQLWVSGLAHHGRSSYSAEKLATLNERAWGLGWGKTLRQDGIHQGVFGLALLDSHKQMQYQLGYTYEKAHYLNHDWYIAAGVAPVIIRREDMFKKLPFPAVFPLMSIGNQKAELRILYIPRLSKNLGNGDVLYVFTTFKF